MNILKMVVLTTVMILTGMAVQAAELPAVSVQHFAGEIANINVKLGTIEFKREGPLATGEVIEYRINKNDTRVTDPLDQKFLTIDDLQAGQHAIIDVVKGQEEKVIQKIVAEPYLEAGLQQAFGSIEAIDSTVGTFTIKERHMVNEMENDHLTSFVFEPKEIIIMQDPGIEPVQLVLNAGDHVRVIYVIKDGQNHAQSITQYVMKATQTTVTTTTITTTQ